MALAPVAYVLYRDVMRHNPADPSWPDRDRFVLSAGHGCMLLYAAAPPRRLRPRRSTTSSASASGARARPATPSSAHTPGVETTTGPLGQGIGERRRHGDRRAIPRRSASTGPATRSSTTGPTPLLRRRPDGGHLRRGGVARRAPGARASSSCVYDDNHDHARRPDDAGVRARTSRARFEAYGWHVAARRRRRTTSTRSTRRLTAAARAETAGRRSIVVPAPTSASARRTRPDTSEAHGAPLGADEVARHQGGARAGPPTHVSRPGRTVRALMGRAIVRARTARARGLGRERSTRYRAAFPDLGRGVRAPTWRGRRPAAGTRCAAGLRAGRERGHPRTPARSVMQRDRARACPSWSAAPPTSSVDDQTDARGRRRRSRRRLRAGATSHFGVREHAMGAIVNGIALPRRPAAVRARRSSSSPTTCARLSASPR